MCSKHSFIHSFIHSFTQQVCERSFYRSGTTLGPGIQVVNSRLSGGFNLGVRLGGEKYRAFENYTFGEKIKQGSSSRCWEKPSLMRGHLSGGQAKGVGELATGLLFLGQALCPENHHSALQGKDLKLPFKGKFGSSTRPLGREELYPTHGPCDKHS